MSDKRTAARTPSGGKRLGMERSTWMGDWFASHSPRNSNSNAEGPWDHWVDLAIQILQHPATALVRPEAHQLAATMVPQHFYDETNRALTDAECDELFPE